MSGYVWGGDPELSIDADRWSKLDRTQLAKEQLDVCADVTRQRYAEHMEAKGLTLHFRPRIPALDRKLLREAIDTIARAAA